MLFLIEYAREKGELITFKTFSDKDSTLAKNTRLELELELNRRGVNREVVLLEAENEEALRRTHRRYFENLEQLVS